MWTGILIGLGVVLIPSFVVGLGYLFLRWLIEPLNR